jgi:hypothetical protein
MALLAILIRWLALSLIGNSSQRSQRHNINHASQSVQYLKDVSKLRFELDSTPFGAIEAFDKKNERCCFSTANGVNGVVANQRGVGDAFETTL